MDWTVRYATPADAATVREVARESWHAAYDDLLGPETVDETVSDWYAADDLEASIDDARTRDGAAFLLATANDEGAGFAHAGRLDGGGTALLSRLYVRPDRWGDGAGTALLERVEAELRPPCDRLRAVVLAANEVGVSFYESAGFDRLETRPSDLGDGLEEHVYDRSLADP
ncbi:GNAT family N-acetyltransferase [Natronolimnohabitans innermongolicus]|uniref:GCN5-like N-acetyltransferase n=1 Tax=Natronolimnohabitans innermongolicus JCM 12255 TaxID=1227499 RepID=L9WTI6_9EURY|nr:GNAT family N-acetyltransferase [Natronolimnohabitans innermongolicus]ELY52506.1 GCN5-like N-acetyltransferase [Natronolimnohabitans innermongolicus JCM 12255]